MPELVRRLRITLCKLDSSSQLMREPLSIDLRAAIEKGYSLRDTINANFDQLRQRADAVPLDFGPLREDNLAL